MYYRKIENKINGCDLCNFSKEEVNKELGATYGYGGQHVMIVGLAPSYKRNKDFKYPLSKEYDNFTAGILFKALEEISWPIDKTYFTNIIKCSTSSNNRIPDFNELDICYNTFFLQELFLINPLGIICLGNFVFEYLKSKGLQNIFHIKHHSYISRNISKYNDWKLDWTNILYEIDL